MEKRNIEIHQFTIHPRGDRKTNLALYDVEGVDLYALVEQGFMIFVDNLPKDASHKRVIRISSDNDDDAYKTLFKTRKNSRLISGKIVTGEYGKFKNVIDINKKKGVPIFKIKDTHAVERPFYFMICIPDSRNEGFILLERDGQFGIKEIFLKTFRQFVNANFKLFTIDFKNYIDDEIAKNIVTKGEMKSITLTRHSLPGDIADKYNLGRFDTDDFYIELKIGAKGNKRITGSARKKAIEIFENNPQGFFTFGGFKDIGFTESCTMKVTSSYNDATRTINLHDTLKIRPYYEIKVGIDSGGHSDFSSIDTKCLELLKSLNIDIL